jgi:hypothetical protein
MFIFSLFTRCLKNRFSWFEKFLANSAQLLKSLINSPASSCDKKIIPQTPVQVNLSKQTKFDITYAKQLDAWASKWEKAALLVGPYAESKIKEKHIFDPSMELLDINLSKEGKVKLYAMGIRGTGDSIENAKAPYTINFNGRTIEILGFNEGHIARILNDIPIDDLKSSMPTKLKSFTEIDFSMMETLDKLKL